MDNTTEPTAPPPRVLHWVDDPKSGDYETFADEAGNRFCLSGLAIAAVNAVRRPELVDNNAKMLGDLIGLLLPHVGATGANEGAVDVLKRLIAERDAARAKLAEVTPT